MKSSDYIVQYLKIKGIKYVFELCGGAINDMLISLNQEKDIETISVHHEQTAAFAADAYGKIARKPLVALATSGPGATNLITGIGSCYFDSVPSIYITGQVSTNDQDDDGEIRQFGFQETNIVEMVKTITKYAVEIKNVNELPEVLEHAFSLSVSGRPGPVLISLPKNIQEEDVSFKLPMIETNVVHSKEHSSLNMKDYFSALNNAKRPLIIAGGGIQISNTAHRLENFLHNTNIPVVISLMAKDILTSDSPHLVGMIGNIGDNCANLALMKSDLILVLGSRMDKMQVGDLLKSDEAKNKVFFVNNDSNEVLKRYDGCKKIADDLNVFFNVYEQEYINEDIPKYDKWHKELIIFKKTTSIKKEVKENTIEPNKFFETLSLKAEGIGAYVSDVGQHQFWAAKNIRIKNGERFITSGGMGAIGYALPSSIGAYYALKKTVVAIAGDGGFQLNLQELETIRHLNLPIKIVLINNNCHGMVRIIQEKYYDECYQSSYWGYSSPDFCKISDAYKIDSMNISSPADIEEALTWLLSDDAPKLLQVNVDTFVGL